MVRKTKWGMIALGALVWACATDGQGDLPGGTVGNESPFSNGSEQPGSGATENPINTGSEGACNITVGDALGAFDGICDKVDQCGGSTRSEPPIEEEQYVRDGVSDPLLPALRWLRLRRTLGTSVSLADSFGAACEALTACREDPSHCELEDGVSLSDTEVPLDNGVVCVSEYLPCYRELIAALPCELTLATLQNFQYPASCKDFFEPTPEDDGNGNGGSGGNGPQ